MIALYLISFLIASIYHLNKHFFKFWNDLKIKQIEPTFFVGNAGKLFSMKYSIGDFIEEIYNNNKSERFIGVYLSYRPVLFVNDPELAQQILISDFNIFHDRPTPDKSAKNYPIMKNLFVQKGKKWRDLRVKISPAFSSAKLRSMFPIMRDCGQLLQKYISHKISNDETIFEFKDLCARFTVDNILSVAFGVENNCIDENENIFYKIISSVFAPTLRNGILGILIFFTPELFTKLKISPTTKEVDQFINKLVNETVEYREKNNIQRKDFLQLLIELKNQGYMSADKNICKNDELNIMINDDGVEEDVQKLTIDELIAQAYIFLSAGFETSSSTMAYAIFELARNKEAQVKAQKEIEKVMQEAETGEISYDLLNEMKYVDCCIDETLRKYPIGSWLIRENSKDYEIPGTRSVLPKGTAVFIPSIGIQRDPDIYDDPLTFKPERFLNSTNGSAKVKGATFLAFGLGNRSCVAARMGKLQSKLGIVMLLSKFSFELDDKSLETEELINHPKSLVLAPLKPVMIKVKQLEPSFLFGNAGKIFTMTTSFGDYFEDIYNKTKSERFMGAYLSYSPILIVNDPELIQNIMISDFTTFHDRPTPGDAAENYPLVGNLFNLRGQKWRDLRIKLSPTFTSGKLKVMFPIMRDCGKVLQTYVEKQIKSGQTVFEFKDLCARFTINNISSVAFGVENDCINDPDNVFRKMGLKLFEPSLRNGIINSIAFLTPKLFTILKIPPFPADLEQFIYSLVTETVEYREKNNFQRNDFMQLMIQLKNQGYVSADKDANDDENEWKNEKREIKKMTIDEMAAQAFVFFGAGFETSSSTMSFSLFELARNKDIQKKVQEEIDEVMKKTGSDEFTYDLLNEMKYLDCVVDETLRKYPILAALFRVGTKDYSIPNSNLVLPKDTPVYMPIIGIQRDPEIFEDPMAFKPERFLDSPTGGAKVKGAVYVPFGTGSRNCIGARLGKLQTKLGLATVLAKFNFELKDKSLEKGELKYNPKSFVLTPITPVMMKVTLR
ncbi:hypothetical protein PVAND_010768 [Polypedilum vanderplanki]|uniref:Cytochrome P450 n=1 Tax=Polypedilum vanderplanki TaxID=319348 RepID=A0A9J6CHI5_POLVA|nr:hypothetical protein PVAND_010768 [Polypedilum vanderplanki]